VRIGKRVSVNAPRSLSYVAMMLCVYYFISTLSELCYVWNRTPAVKILFDYPTILKEELVLRLPPRNAAALFVLYHYCRCQCVILSSYAFDGRLRPKLPSDFTNTDVY
jgi:hypothetical protein